MKKLLFILIVCSLSSCISEEEFALDYLDKHKITTLSEFNHWRIQTRGPKDFHMYYMPFVDTLIEGKIERTDYIKSNDPEQPEVEIQLTANIKK